VKLRTSDAASTSRTGFSQSDRRGGGAARLVRPGRCRALARCGSITVRFPVGEVQLWNERGGAGRGSLQLLEQGSTGGGRRGCAPWSTAIVRSTTSTSDPTRSSPSRGRSGASSAPLGGSLAGAQHWPVEGRLRASQRAESSQTAMDELAAARSAGSHTRARASVAIDSTAPPIHAPSRASRPEDENLILSFHFYDPLLFTHYRASLERSQGYEGTDRLPESSPSDGGLGRASGSPWLRRAQRAGFAQRIRTPPEADAPLAGKTGMPLWCGEVSARLARSHRRASAGTGTC